MRLNNDANEQFMLADYAVQEDGGNLDASKLDGGASQITFSLKDYPASSRLMDDSVTLTDDPRGSVQGTVRGLSGSNGVLSGTADGVLSLLNLYKAVPPPPAVTTTFGAYAAWLINTYLGLGQTVFVSSSISGDSFPFPGFVGNVFDQLKMLCAARKYTMVARSKTITFEPARNAVLTETTRDSSSYSLSTQQAAQQIVVNYKNYTANGNFAAYPPVGSDPADLSPITVNAGETVVQTYSISGTASSVSQPVARDTITLGGTNQYAIIGNDGLPVSAAQWTAGGGKVTARVLPADPSQIEVTVRGMTNKTLAPYRLAESSGNNYSALYIQAQGYGTTPKSITINTGAAPAATSEIVGTTVDNPYINTLADAYTTGLITAAYYAGPTYSINDTAARLINPTSTPGADQSFGFLVGNRLLRTDAGFIVTSTNITPGSMSYQAVLDTMISDFNTAWSGQTFDAFNNQWAGYTFTEMTPIPLRRY